MKGFAFSDKVCITASDCISNFTFFGIIRRSGLLEVNGYLGLGPTGADNAPSYIISLYNAGILPQA